MAPQLPTTELKDLMRVAIASAFALGLKAQNFHWNVDGMAFVELHQLFGDIYEDVFASVDGLAERLRTMRVYAPGGLERFHQMSVIEDAPIHHIGSKDMVSALDVSNQQMLQVLYALAEQASALHLEGLMNFVADRIDRHERWSWMLRAVCKADSVDEEAY